MESAALTNQFLREKDRPAFLLSTVVSGVDRCKNKDRKDLQDEKDERPGLPHGDIWVSAGGARFPAIS